MTTPNIPVFWLARVGKNGTNLVLTADRCRWDRNDGTEQVYVENHHDWFSVWFFNHASGSRQDFIDTLHRHLVPFHSADYNPNCMYLTLSKAPCIDSVRAESMGPEHQDFLHELWRILRVDNKKYFNDILFTYNSSWDEDQKGYWFYEIQSEGGIFYSTHYRGYRQKASEDIQFYMRLGNNKGLGLPLGIWFAPQQIHVRKAFVQKLFVNEFDFVDMDDDLPWGEEDRFIYCGIGPGFQFFWEAVRESKFEFLREEEKELEEFLLH